MPKRRRDRISSGIHPGKVAGRLPDLTCARSFRRCTRQPRSSPVDRPRTGEAGEAGFRCPGLCPSWKLCRRAQSAYFVVSTTLSWSGNKLSRKVPLEPPSGPTSIQCQLGSFGSCFLLQSHPGTAATETAANLKCGANLTPPRLNSLLRCWVPICARYEIVGGTGVGIGENQASENFKKVLSAKIPGRESTKVSCARKFRNGTPGETPGHFPAWTPRQNSKRDSGPVIAGNSGGARFLNFLAYTPTTLGNFPLGSFHWSELP